MRFLIFVSLWIEVLSVRFEYGNSTELPEGIYVLELLRAGGLYLNAGSDTPVGLDPIHTGNANQQWRVTKKGKGGVLAYSITQMSSGHYLMTDPKQPYWRITIVDRHDTHHSFTSALTYHRDIC